MMSFLVKRGSAASLRRAVILVIPSCLIPSTHLQAQKLPIPAMSGSWGKPLTLRSEFSQAPPTITEKNIPDLSNKVRGYTPLNT